VPHRERVYCDGCLPRYQHDRYEVFVAAGQAKKQQLRADGVDPSHGGDAAIKRGRTMSRRRRELREWHASHGAGCVEPDAFQREILPLLGTVPISDLVRATGLTHGYLSQVRRGKKSPHPRHWEALRQAVARSNEGG
jgi:hypothetical protein